LQIQQGPGWRFGFDLSRHPYPVLIGGEGWASEFRQQEAAALHQAAQRLRHQWLAIRDQLMPEEEISLDTECGPLWAELDGTAEAVSLRFVLQPPAAERALEGCWSGPATEALIAVLAQTAQAEQWLGPA
jgi:hypothetical protein